MNIYEVKVLSTIQTLGLQALLSSGGFDIAEHYRKRVYDINATTPYRHDQYTDARMAMLDELTKLVGLRLTEEIDQAQLEDGESIQFEVRRIIEASAAALAAGEVPQ